ncbi:MAG: esterase family protein [Cyclobacteriaceae bacterium]|nr:esterase family protein [Cyclobacteriaceae bacterium]
MSKFFTSEVSSPGNEFDNLRWITVKSKALHRRADVTVFVPPNPENENLDVVILLHGVYGSHWAWAMNGGVHKIAHQLIEQGKIRPMVLVMPSDGLYGDGSGYLTHLHEDYEKWIVEDVVHVVQEQIACVTNQSSFFITGLSMGGYGALRLGAKYPTVFKSFSGLSCITEFSQMAMFLEEGEFSKFSNHVVKRENVLDCLLANKETLPHFRFDCGREDILIDFNRKLHQSLNENKIKHSYIEHPGKHEWIYWQAHIQESLLYFNEFSIY